MPDPSSFQVPGFVTSRYKFRLYLLKHLPMALLGGLKPVEVAYDRAKISLPFTYLTKNPFRSIYFAAQCMAAELSSGVLCMSHILNLQKPVSLLVVGMEAEFFKKAKRDIYFVCEDGAAIADAIERAAHSETAEPTGVTVSALAVDDNGNEYSKFKFTWSFKRRS